MVESTIQPEDIYIESIKGGVVTVLCRWNIISSTRTNDDGTTQTIWTYDETRIPWTIDGISKKTTADDVTSVFAYIESNKALIINFAKSAKVTITDVNEMNKARNVKRKADGLI